MKKRRLSVPIKLLLALLTVIFVSASGGILLRIVGRDYLWPVAGVVYLAPFAASGQFSPRFSQENPLPAQ